MSTFAFSQAEKMLWLETVTPCIFVFGFAICSIAAYLPNLSGSDLSGSTKITDLNDDVLYGTFAHLELEDLNNLIYANDRFAPAAQWLFSTKAMKSIMDWRKRQINYEWKNMDGDALMLIRVFTPRGIGYHEQMKLHFLFKFLTVTTVGNQYGIDMPQYVNAVKPYVEMRMKMSEANSNEDFENILTLYNHHIFIRTFLDWDRKNKKELGWMCYAYMLIVEKSARHLENQFPYEMMAHLNRIRNAANAFALTYTESNSTTSTFEYHERFLLDWNLFKGKTPSVEAKAKFHLILAKEEIRKLHTGYHRDFCYSERGLKYFSRVYCAIRALSGPRFQNLLNVTNLNLAIFDSAIQDKFVGKLRRSLEEECSGTEVLETGLQQQIDNFDELIGEKMGDADTFFSLLFRDLRAEKTRVYYSKAWQSIDKAVENLAHSTDFSDYIKLLKVCVMVARHQKYEMLKSFKKLYFAYFTFVDRPEAFDNADELREVDRLHTKLLNLNLGLADYRDKEYPNSERAKHLLNVALENFGPLLSSMTESDTSETRKKQRIVLKMMIFLSGTAFHECRTSAPDVNNNQILKVVKMFHKFVSLDNETLTTDSSLIELWNQLINYMKPVIKSIYTRTDIVEFAFIYRPYESSGDLATDTFVYSCLLSLAYEFDASGLPIPEQMFENIMILEESIGEVETLEFLQFNIQTRKMVFYDHFSNKIKNRLATNHLKRFVESKFNMFLSETDDYKEALLALQIYVAIRENKEAAKEQLGSELIEILGQISFYDYRAFGYIGIKPEYDAFREIFHIKSPPL